MIKTKKIPNNELDTLYGGHRRFDIGDCFVKDNGHYYMQNEHNVTHINKDDMIINILHNRGLDGDNVKKISLDDFQTVIKETIFNMGIYDFCKIK